MSALWLKQTGEKILYLRVGDGGQPCVSGPRPELQWHTAFLWYVRHGPASQALKFSI